LKILFTIVIIFISSINGKSQEIFEYKIKLLGIPVANCLVSYSDTIITNVNYKKLDYKVITTSFIDRIFKIDNHYTVIINKTDYSTIYYNKTSYQPNVINQISAKLIDDRLQYDNSEISINKKNFNIFTVLYLFHLGRIDILKNIDYIEREGKYYYFSIEEVKINQFSLYLEEIDDQKKGVIKDTDIFLWGLFLDNSDKKIILDSVDSKILKCVFNRGFTTISAKLK
tara:strand:+ start:1493 stop:2173 length:681 start_codon:yes stop_codon:yes gene_type:complete